MRFRIAAVALVALASCQRERRDFRPQPPSAGVFLNLAAEGTLVPGGAAPQQPPANPDHGSAYDISEGQRLYESYNCVGCHFHGGGGIGPPLIKSNWIYGGSPAQIFDTIARGRPNGMPTWGGRIPAYQIWQIVTYIRSLNQEEPTAATPVRSDEVENQPVVRNQHGGESHE